MDKVIGLDLGKKTLGIACSDILGIAHGVETYRFKAFDYEDAANYADKIAKARGVKIFALGLPLHLSGQMSEMAQNVMTFKELLLSKDKSYKIELIDER
ncbi:MAG: Holliday junction resolvase RuvX, partial [Bacilli bacterium]|nr:Holliday junction resolvase RuvX [Bacilli bacterium]